MSSAEKLNLKSIADNKIRQAREQYGFVGKLLSEGKTTEAMELIRQARKLELEAKSGYLEVGRLLSQGDAEAAGTLIKASRQKEQTAKHILNGELQQKSVEYPQSIQHIIEQAEKFTYAFTPTEIQYIAKRLMFRDDFHHEDVLAFQTISNTLEQYGFNSEVDTDILKEKLTNGFIEIALFFDSQAPEGQLIVAALQPRSQNLEFILNE